MSASTSSYYDNLMLVRQLILQVYPDVCLFMKRPSNPENKKWFVFFIDKTEDDKQKIVDFLTHLMPMAGNSKIIGFYAKASAVYPDKNAIIVHYSYMMLLCMHAVTISLHAQDVNTRRNRFSV